MTVFRVIFWVTVIESLLGHLPPWTPLVAFVAFIIVDQLGKKKKKEANGELTKALENMKKRQRKDDRLP